MEKQRETLKRRTVKIKEMLCDIVLECGRDEIQDLVQRLRYARTELNELINDFK